MLELIGHTEGVRCNMLVAGGVENKQPNFLIKNIKNSHEEMG